MSRYSSRPAILLVFPVVFAIAVASCGSGDSSGQEHNQVDGADQATDQLADTNGQESGPELPQAASVDNDSVSLETSTTEAGVGDSDTSEGGVDDAAEVLFEPKDYVPLVVLPNDTADLSYEKHIEPIIEEACAGCHVGQGAGIGHLRLETAADVVANSGDLSLYINAGLMPPWLPTDGDVALEKPWHITDEELQAVVAWAANGAQLDVDPSTPVDIPPLDPAIRLPQPDVELPLPEPYLSTNGRADDYRCFVLDELVESDTFLIGHQFFPDATEVVHHMLFYGINEAGFTAAQAKDEADPGLGYECFGGPGVGGATGSLASWTPGSRPFVQPEGTGVRVKAGTRFVMQIHYHYEGSRPTDQSKLILDFADEGADLTPLVGQLLLGPVEIPCLPNQDGPECDRDLAVQRLLDESLRAAGMPEFLLNWCDNENVVPKDPTELPTTSCDTKAWTTGEVIRVGAHMHEIGVRFRVILNPDTPEELVLIDIPRWDFNWQGGYNLVQPVPITPADTVRIECTWDRTLRKDDSPRYILWGDGTGQEMCITSLTIRPPD